jgi:proteasome lid subunit RPN8/RPN11
VLFGQIDEFLRVIWIDEVSGPPPDSVASADGFICGVAGVAEMNAEKIARTRRSVAFIGMWHTHPGGKPRPSPVDRSAMRELLGSPNFHGRHFLMLIVGGSASSPNIAGSLFDRHDR